MQDCDFRDITYVQDVCRRLVLHILSPLCRGRLNGSLAVGEAVFPLLQGRRKWALAGNEHANLAMDDSARRHTSVGWFRTTAYDSFEILNSCKCFCIFARSYGSCFVLCIEATVFL